MDVLIETSQCDECNKILKEGDIVFFVEMAKVLDFLGRKSDKLIDGERVLYEIKSNKNPPVLCSENCLVTYFLNT